MKQYTIWMTCSGGTAIAGDYIAETKRKALATAKKEHGDEWTYYVHEEKKIGLEGQHYFIARYWNNVDNQLTYYEDWRNFIRFRYGNKQKAEKELKTIKKKTQRDDWQIFWINTDRDDRRTPESVRVYIEAKGEEMERLKETDYAAWLREMNDR